MTPKRVDEVLERRLALSAHEGRILVPPNHPEDRHGRRRGPALRCEVTVDPTIVRVAPPPRRPFQGWRYLEARTCRRT